MVLDYQSCCPDSQMVLLGYSQGAQVTADFLCGRSELGFDPTPAYASQVVENRESPPYFIYALLLSVSLLFFSIHFLNENPFIIRSNCWGGGG